MILRSARETCAFPHAGRKILSFWTFLLLASGLLVFSRASVPGAHGGRVILERGRQFEVVANPALHQIRIYAAPTAGPPESTLTIHVPSRAKARTSLKLILSEPNRDSWVYTGLVPAGILVRAGMKVEIDPPDRR